ncbi:MAG: hypothetical protein ACT4QB_21535 [Gammaproteobacteria bacterium]
MPLPQPVQNYLLHVAKIVTNAAVALGCIWFLEILVKELVGKVRSLGFWGKLTEDKASAIILAATMLEFIGVMAVVTMSTIYETKSFFTAHTVPHFGRIMACVIGSILVLVGGSILLVEVLRH